MLGVVVASSCTSGGSGTVEPGGTTAGGELQACDPLSTDASPITLGTIVAAGRAKNGTVYLVDRSEGAGLLRAFVSDGLLLRRRTVSGSGETPDFVTVSLGDDPRTALHVRIELSGGTAKRMAISNAPPDPKTKSFDIDTQGEELALIPSSDLSAFTLVNLSGRRLTYAASTPDGHRFVLFMPSVDYSEDKIG